MDESIKRPLTWTTSLAPKVKWIHNSKIAVELGTGCLRVDKLTFTNGDVANLLAAYSFDIWS